MIAKLTGLIDETGDDWLILDVGGVGYLLQCSAKTLAHLPGVNEQARLWVETIMRAESLVLYGFASLKEQEWFRLLTTVQGVGPKVALAILSALSLDELYTALLTKDKAQLTRAEGVGGKLGDRILNELKEKFQSLGSSHSSITPLHPSTTQDQEAVSALQNLGYKPFEATQAIALARTLGPESSLENLIRSSLQILMKGGLKAS